MWWLSAFSANVHSRLLEALAQASPTPAEELIREHLNPWIVALSAAAVKESTKPEAVSFHPWQVEEPEAGRAGIDRW